MIPIALTDPSQEFQEFDSIAPDCSEPWIPVSVEESHDGTAEADDIQVADTPTVAEQIVEVTIANGREVRQQVDALYEAKERLISISLEMEETARQIDSYKARLKELREEHTEAAATLRQLQENEDDRNFGDGEWNPSPDTPATEVVASPECIESSGPTADWRSKPVTAINLEGIEGLGPKKIEKLIEEIPTVGELEDLRIAASSAREPLHKKLPKGIGKQSGDIITDRLITWIAKNQHGMDVSAEKLPADRVDPPSPPDDLIEESEAAVEQAIPASPDSPPDELPPVPEPVDADPETAPKPKRTRAKKEKPADPAAVAEPAEHALPEDEEAIEARRLKLLQDRHGELSAMIPVLRPAPAYGEIADDGRRAAASGDAVTDCNWTDPAKMESWLLGYVAHVE